MMETFIITDDEGLVSLCKNFQASGKRQQSVEAIALNS